MGDLLVSILSDVRTSFWKRNILAETSSINLSLKQSHQVSTYPVGDFHNVRWQLHLVVDHKRYSDAQELGEAPATQAGILSSNVAKTFKNLHWNDSPC